MPDDRDGRSAPTEPLLYELPAAAAVIRRGTTRLAQRLRMSRGAQALSSNKIAVLGHLYRHGASTPRAVADAEHQQPQSLTRVFAELEADGLLGRAPSETDGRQAVLSISDRGREVLVADMAERDSWLVTALASLTPAEVAVLAVTATLLDRLADAPPST